MINLRNAKRIAIIGSTIEAWFAALTFRRISSTEVEVIVYDDEQKISQGLGAGSLPVLSAALQANQINIDEFAFASDLTIKLGSSFENWRHSGDNDVFFHLFHGFNQGVEELDVIANRTYPFLAGRIAKNIDLVGFYPGFSMFTQNIPQVQANLILGARKSGLIPSYHFDVQKCVNYLKNIAIGRGVKHQIMKVHKLVLDDEGNTTALNTDLGDINVDFVVDAADTKRLSLGEAYKSKWHSLKEQFPINRVLQFNVEPAMVNPRLYTRAIAMKCGWLQLVPLKNHISASYFLTSKYTSDEAALKEAADLLEQKITFANPVDLDQGYFESNWHKNTLAVGPAVGFIEPLVSASLAQFFSLIYKVEQAVIEGHGIIGETTIAAINKDHAKTFNEIADFTRLHYETQRKDSSFWRDVKKLPRSKTYQELRKVFAERFPRAADLENYSGFGWPPLFVPLDWITVASAMGIVTPQTALSELDVMPAEIFEQVNRYLQG
ncbi:tryptophan 7-halogenase [Bartonella sp. HY329]|uniref:tryptophan 7-halogenase n=1 Tax=unclassified Bartonella TaxID=2645622 RepID=UPI0021C67E88|nr:MULTISPECIES: tryptophan 7-halogenase [unclassified Bartonella]UXM94796.1 tryptophan 7-halogenase [Bartonella sp. HY329]UXN09119.1 tryptophan 7-halogenase [Bartonella sp. HY328]